MSHPEGTVSFDAGGGKYTAVFGFRAIADVEAQYDRPFAEVIQAVFPQVSPDEANDRAAIARAAAAVRFTDMGMLFRAALLKHHPELTGDEVFDLIDEIGLTRVGAILGKVLSATLVAEKGGEAAGGGGANPPRRGRQGRTG